VNFSKILYHCMRVHLIKKQTIEDQRSRMHEAEVHSGFGWEQSGLRIGMSQLTFNEHLPLLIYLAKALTEWCLTLEEIIIE
jgi:hypothetical protein